MMMMGHGFVSELTLTLRCTLLKPFIVSISLYYSRLFSVFEKVYTMYTVYSSLCEITPEKDCL